MEHLTFQENIIRNNKEFIESQRQKIYFPRPHFPTSDVSEESSLNTTSLIITNKSVRLLIIKKEFHKQTSPYMSVLEIKIF